MRILLTIPVGSLFLGILLACFVAVSAWAEGGLPFNTAAVTRETVTLERVLDGTVDAVNQATVSAQTSGEVIGIEYDVDDFVNQGDIIVRLKDTQQKAGLRQARASVEEAAAKLREGEQEYARVKGVFDRKLVAKAQLDKATAALKSAQARLSAARASVVRATEQQENTLIRAPYSGLVTHRHVELGEFVNVGQPLMTGVSLDSLRINVDVPQRQINRIRAHNEARLIPDGAGFGAVPIAGLTFFPFADPATNTFKVRVNLAQKVVGLFPGMFVKVAFTIGEAEHLMVPENAVAYRGEVTGIYVIDAQAAAHFRHIRLGHSTGDGKRVVLAGLSEGEQIALDPIAAGIYLKQTVKAGGKNRHD